MPRLDLDDVIRPPRARAAVLCAAAALLAAGALAAPARAEYAPGVEPASATATEIGDGDSVRPLVSGDGRYVVFDTSARNLLGAAPREDQYHAGGIVRKDLLTGELALVAPPERRRRADGGLVDPGTRVGQAGISADGRWILFSTVAPLSPADRGQTSRDVYVRDMNAPLSDAGSFELVSARDGEETGATYRDGALGAVPGEAGFALSDDGRTALFVTLSESNLPAAAAPSTPAKQVWVRDLDARTTRLVTRDLADPSPSGRPVPTFPEEPRHVRTVIAALSGDGRAVAWVGPSAERQARFLPGEPVTPDQPHLLWRDLGAGPAAPARRVAGIADPDDPACAPGSTYVPDEVATGPCYGPFAQIENTNAAAEENAVADLGISDDGRRVVFRSGARSRPYAPERARTVVYLADMTPGLPRKAAVRQVASLPPDGPAIEEHALTGDGRTLALTTSATSIPGTQPVGTFPSGARPGRNAYALDLERTTLERVTRAPSGEDYLYVGNGADDVSALSVSDDGATIAFVAADANLFVGDANGRRDVLVARRVGGGDGDGDGDGPGHPLPDPPPPPVVEESPLTPLAPVHADAGPVRVDRRGVARVRVWLPAAGALRATARARVAKRRLAVGAARRTVAASRTVTVRIAPSRAARRALATTPRRPLRVTLTLSFRPRSGAATAQTRRYELRAARSRPRR